MPVPPPQYSMQSSHPFAQKVARKADWALDDGDYQTALDFFEQALQHDPAFDYARWGLAKAHTELQNYDVALTTIEELSSRYPEEQELLNEKGLILKGQKKWNAAQNIFESIITQDPSYAAAYANLGELFEHIEQEEKAVRIYQRFLQHSSHQDDIDEVNYRIERIQRKQRREERRLARAERKKATTTSQNSRTDQTTQVDE